MLKLRILSALVMVPIVIGAIFMLDASGFAVAMAAVFVLAAWEWSRLCGYRSRLAQFVFPVIFTGLAYLLWQVCYASPLALNMLLWTGLVWWVGGMLFIFRANRHAITIEPSQSMLMRLRRSLIGLLVLLPSFIALSALQARAQGTYYIMYILFLIWVADSGAYFVGRKYGRRKLVANVSPGKSWEGVIGGLISSLLLSIVVVSFLGLSLQQGGLVVVLSLVTVWFSIMGDLLESLFKRYAGLKDSSQLIPGHGGVLDRIDSLTSAAPIFLLGLLWLERVAR